MAGLMRDVAEDGESVNSIAGSMANLLKILAVVAIAVGAAFVVIGERLGAIAAAGSHAHW